MAGEKNFENRIKRFLRENKVWHVKFFANAFTRKGVPDLLCCVAGHFVAVEVKAEDGRVSELQRLQLKGIADSLGFAIVLRPGDFDTFRHFVMSLMDNDLDLAMRYFCQLKEANI